MDLDARAFGLLEHLADLLERNRLKRIQHDPLQKPLGVLHGLPGFFVAGLGVGAATRQQPQERRDHSVTNVRRLGSGCHGGRVTAHPFRFQTGHVRLQVSTDVPMNVDGR